MLRCSQTFRVLTLTILAMLARAPLARGQQDFSNVTIKVTPVRDGIYMLEGAGGNIGLSVGTDDAFIIDDQYAPVTPKVRAAIATVTPRPVRFVLNTHWHGDHTGGNEAMASVGAIIVAHDNVRRRMSTEQFTELFNSRTPASHGGALPAVTFSDDISFFLNGDTIHAGHVRNAHTDGDAIVTFRKANVIHMGDTFFNGFYPYIDVSAGGSIDGMIAAVNAVLARSSASTMIIPGHGPLASRADLVRYRDVLVIGRRNVARLVTQGRTMAQAIAAKPMAEYDTQWGKGFINGETFIKLVYTSLAQDRQRLRRRGN